MMVYDQLTSERSVPALLQPVYGETTTYAALLLIHGGTLLVTGLLWWLFRTDSLLATSEKSQVAMWLLWDLLGGSLAHLIPANHRYWARLPVEIRLLALASMAWQPLVLVLLFNQSTLLLVELHLFAGLAYWLVTRVPLAVALGLSVLAWAGITYHLQLSTPIALFALLYCVKVVLAYRPEHIVPDRMTITAPLA